MMSSADRISHSEQLCFHFFPGSLQLMHVSHVYTMNVPFGEIKSTQGEITC